MQPTPPSLRSAAPARPSLRCSIPSGSAAIAAVTTNRCPTFVRARTSVQLLFTARLSTDCRSSDIRPWTSVRLSFVERSSTDFRSSDVHPRTSVRRTFVHGLPFDFRSSDVRPTSVRWTFVHRLPFVVLAPCTLRPTSCLPTSYALPLCVIRNTSCCSAHASCVIHPVVLRHAPDVLPPYVLSYYVLPSYVLPFHPTSIWLPCNICVSRVIPNSALYSSNCT